MSGRQSGFFAELKRRKVYHVAAAYVAVGLAVAATAPDLFSAFDLPTAAARFVVLLLVIGFPVALVLAWAYEVKPEEPQVSQAACDARPPPPFPIPLHVEPPDDPRPSLAVLPFVSFSEGTEADYFGLGVMEDVLMRLARVKGIRLISRSSAMRYKAAEKSTCEIARELGVRTVLEGSVRRSGGKVRVVAQLIDGSTDEHLWAETYDRDLEDVFRVQTEIAESIAVALRAELSAEERASVRRVPTENLGAWDLYVRATQAFQPMGRKDLTEAQSLLEEAVRLDPAFAAGWGLSAQVLTLMALSEDEPPSEICPRIHHAATRALELDPRCAEAHTAMAVLRFFHEWDPRGAEVEFDRALMLNPDDTFALDWKAVFLVLCGRAAEALTLARQSLALAPYSAIGHISLGQVLVMSDQLDEACDFLGGAIRNWPHSPVLRQWLGLAYLYRDLAEDALPHFQVGAEVSGHEPRWAAFRATSLAHLGRTDDARQILSELQARSRQQYVDPYWLFAIRFATDGFDDALPHLEEAVAGHSFPLAYLRATKRFRPLHADPRFRAVLDKVFPGVCAEA